jgi:chemotaxis family two-component system response regulator Rcp1
VVLTTTSAERDIAESYDLRANCFITKPVDLVQLLEVVRSIEHSWLEIVRPPGTTP